MTLRLAGPLVGALVGLAAAGIGTVLAAGRVDGTTLAVAAAAVVVASVTAFIASRTVIPRPVPPAAVPAPREASSGSGRSGADRAGLVAACIWMRDRATSPALAAHLDSALAAAGVEAVDATGQRFDPAVHEAGATVAALKPGDDGFIAGTETPGYVDRGRLLRHPIVTVYRGQVHA